MHLINFPDNDRILWPAMHQVFNPGNRQVPLCEPYSDPKTTSSEVGLQHAASLALPKSNIKSLSTEPDNIEQMPDFSWLTLEVLEKFFEQFMLKTLSERPRESIALPDIVVDDKNPSKPTAERPRVTVALPDMFIEH